MRWIRILKSTATAFDYINELCNRGLIKKAGVKNRAVVLTQQADIIIEMRWIRIIKKCANCTIESA